MANIMITGVKITPNPVETKKSLLISVEITDIVYAILASSVKMIQAASGKTIEKMPRKG